MFEDNDVITLLDGDEMEQMEGEGDDAYEVRMAFLREKRRKTMTQEEKDNVAEIILGMADAKRELGYA